MDESTLLALYDNDLRIEMEHPGVRKEIFPQLVRFLRPAPGMNYVAYSRVDEATFDGVIEEQIAYFSQFDQPFSWHVCTHDRPANLPEKLLAHGFLPDDDPDAVMVLELAEAMPALLQPVTLDVRRIVDRDGLDDVVAVEAAVWGGDFGWLKGRLGAHLAIPDYLSVYVIYVDGQPASSSWIYFYPRSHFAGLFGGATLPSYRKQGFYRAALAVRVQEAIKRGYRFVSTGASPMSRPILAQHGFQFLTYAYAYEWGGESSEQQR